MCLKVFAVCATLFDRYYITDAVLTAQILAWRYRKQKTEENDVISLGWRRRRYFSREVGLVELDEARWETLLP
jgi:hypothetical protein